MVWDLCFVFCINFGFNKIWGKIFNLNTSYFVCEMITFFSMIHAKSDLVSIKTDTFDSLEYHLL